MVRLRAPGLMSLPPPAYHPDSTSLTLSIYYHGVLEKEGYVGGRVRKVDYVDIEKLHFISLDEYVQDLITEGTQKTVHTGVSTGHVQLKNDKDLKYYGKKYLKQHREFPLFFVTGEDGRCNTADKVGGEEPHAGTEAQDRDDIEVGEKEVEYRDEVEGGLNDTAKNDADTSVPLHMLSEMEFFMRVENSDEWIAEYNRKFGKPDTTETTQVYANESDSEDEDFCLEDETDFFEDESLLDAIYDQLEHEPEYRVHRGNAANGNPVEWLGFDERVSDSLSSDEEFGVADEEESSDDDNLFKDYVSEDAENSTYHDC